MTPGELLDLTIRVTRPSPAVVTQLIVHPGMYQIFLDVPGKSLSVCFSARDLDAPDVRDFITRQIEDSIKLWGPMPDDPVIFNLDQPRHVAALHLFIDSLRGKGLHSIEIYKIRKGRSLRQNGWLHGVAFPAIAEQLTEDWGRKVTMLEAKDWVKGKCPLLTRPLVDSNGELVGTYPIGTHELDTKECSEFMEYLMTDIAEELRIIIPAPREYEVPDGVE